MLRGRRDRRHRLGLLIPLTVACIATPIQFAVGDTAARAIANDQPVKFAAMECVETTSTDVTEYIYGRCTSNGVKGGIGIPGFDSFLVGWSTDTQVIGLRLRARHCLGHQLAAVALGGAAERNPLGQQFGLLDVGWLPEAHVDALTPVATPRRRVHGTTTSSPSCRRLLSCWPGPRPARCRWSGSPRPCGACSCTPRSTRLLLRPWATMTAKPQAIGVDPDAVLAQSHTPLAPDAAWRPLATRFAQLAAARSVDP